MPINPKKYIDQLIKALEQQGKFYDLSTKRFYSNRTGRYCTKYTIEDKDDRYNSRIEVYNKLEILKYLVREYSRITGKPCPSSCLDVINDD